MEGVEKKKRNRRKETVMMQEKSRDNRKNDLTFILDL